jgi:L-ascorbate metabolism protein UlaG (beta-lactamase superfamily)
VRPLEQARSLVGEGLFKRLIYHHNSEMTYPPSDHYDGKLFFNPEPSSRSLPGKRRGLLAFLLARLRGHPEGWAKWAKRIENTAHPAPSGPPPFGMVDVSFIGHSSFLLRLPGMNILTDPIFSARCSPIPLTGPRRVRDPGIELHALPEIHLTILSHNHYDHMDLPSLRLLRRRFPQMRVVAPLGNASFLKRKGVDEVDELDWWQSVNVAETSVTATPARHFAARWLHDGNRTLWSGFMLTHRGTRIYFGGDTGYTRFFSEIRDRLGSPDIALLPIGAYEPRWFMEVAHMNPADAVRAHQDLNSRVTIGMHFGTFQLTAEPIDAPERDLALALETAGISPTAFTTLDFGETKRFAAGR